MTDTLKAEPRGVAAVRRAIDAFTAGDFAAFFGLSPPGLRRRRCGRRGRGGRDGRLGDTLILLDMSLPVLDEWEVARSLKTAEATSSIPIVALTAHAMTGDRQRALDAGCDDYDTKPIELGRLLGKMQALLALLGAGSVPDAVFTLA